MTKVSRLLGGIGIVLAFAASASADITWTLSDVNFYREYWSPGSPNNTAYAEVASLSGSFSTNDAVTQVTGFSNLKITTQPGDAAYGFTIAGMVDDYLPNKEIGIYSAGWGSYIDLILSNPLTGASLSDSISAGYDCPGCAVLEPNSNAGIIGPGGQISNTNTNPSVPEPGFYEVFAIGLVGLGFAARRKSVIAKYAPKYS